MAIQTIALKRALGLAAPLTVNGVAGEALAVKTDLDGKRLCLGEGQGTQEKYSRQHGHYYTILQKAAALWYNCKER